jgi:alanyl-tRNA synthetase
MKRTSRILSAVSIMLVAVGCGGGGGGRPQMAQAGGKIPEKIDEALKRASEIISEKLQA